MSNVVKLSDYQTKEVVIEEITVKQDSEGRYCLNDVLKASGDDQKHRPKYWLENAQTQALTDESAKGGFPPVSVKVGRNGGTFAVRELVYVYAMWISAEYHLKVIRAYDRLATEGVAVHDNAAHDLLAAEVSSDLNAPSSTSGRRDCSARADTFRGCMES